MGSVALEHPAVSAAVVGAGGDQGRGGLVDGVAIKPAREARAGETVAARTGDLTRVC